MGNVISLDIGIVMLRLAIFDRRGRLKTLLANTIDEESKEETKEKEKKQDYNSQIGDTLGSDGFTFNLTFYSSVHNGTFYFLQYNILRTSEVNYEE